MGAARLLLALAVAAALGLLGAAPAAASGGVEVWFSKDGELVPAPRRAPTVKAAVRALLAGPTAPERLRGLRSAIPAGTPLLDVAVERRVVTVDLGERFAAGRDEASLRGRVRQLVRTVDGIPGVTGVRVLVSGGVPLGLFPGLDLRRPVTVAALGEERRPGTSLRELQELLDDLGFLPTGGPSGVVDDRTSVGVLAFQKWAGLPRDGVLGEATVKALLRAARPSPASLEPGRRVEVLLDRQVALLVDGPRVLRVVHISTGAFGTSTPAGSFRVYRKERYSWSVPFSVWMPWASYFTGGIAFHEYSSVPPYPASHGCVRVNRYDAPLVYSFAGYGTPVRVLWSQA